MTGIRPPVVRTPDTRIDYPTIDVPTEQEFQGDMGPQQPQQPTPTPDTRDLPQTPVINVGGVDVLPRTWTTCCLGSLSGNNSCHSWCHDWCEPAQTVIGTLAQEVTPTKEEKIKIKQVKPVLHFIPNEDGTSDVIQDSQKA